MKNLINKAQLIGCLGKDPEVKEIEGGSKYARFSLAVSDYYKNASGDKVETTYWINIVCWNGLADVAQKFLRKGSKIAMEGKIVTRTYKDKQGVKKYSFEVVMNEMLMIPVQKAA